MIKNERKKLKEEDFLLDIKSISCKVPQNIDNELEEKIEKLSNEFDESAQRKKLLRL